MAYFDNARVGDDVYDLVYGWGEIIEVEEKLIRSKFILKDSSYIITKHNFEGIGAKHYNQTLFWDEIEFTTPEPPRREYKFKPFKGQYCIWIDEYTTTETGAMDNAISNGQYRHTEEQAQASLKRIKKANRLEMLVYDIQEEVGGDYYVYKKGDRWEYNSGSSYYPEVVLMYEETAERICKLLNSGEYKLCTHLRNY